MIRDNDNWDNNRNNRFLNKKTFILNLIFLIIYNEICCYQCYEIIYCSIINLASYTIV